MRLRHIYTGLEGEFIREFTPTGRFYRSFIIRLHNGKEYAASFHEFEEIR